MIGAPRSGTSFLGDALGSLPEFSYHYEPALTKAAARYVHDGLASPLLLRLLYRGTYRMLLRRRLDGDLQLAEKTPQNCFAARFLSRTFPRARFVHIIRDGRDAAASHRQKPWLRRDGDNGKRESGGYRFGPYPRFWVATERREEFRATSDLHRCIWAWRAHVEAALEQGGNLLPDRYLEVRYEHLCRQPAEQGERILAFLGINSRDSREQLLDRLGQAKVDSIGRWKSSLTRAEQDEILAEAGDLLALLGYIDNGTSA